MVTSTTIRNSSFSLLRISLKAISIFQAFCLIIKLVAELCFTVQYYSDSCKNISEEVEPDFCHSIHLLFSTIKSKSNLEIAGLACGVVALDILECALAVLKYLAVNSNNSSKSKLCFRVGVCSWLSGIILWLYLVSTSYILLSAVIVIYIFKYLLLLLLQKYLHLLTVHQCQQQSMHTNAENTKL